MLFQDLKTGSVLESTERNVKVQITKLVVDQFRQINKIIGAAELTAIVDAEYERVKCRLIGSGISSALTSSTAIGNVNPVSDAAQPVSKSLPSSFEDRGDINNLRVDWNAVQNAVQLVTSSGPGENERRNEDESSCPDEALDELTVDDLVSLFNNFQELDSENKAHLMEYMKKLEKTNPAKVHLLKQHIHEPF